MTEMRMTLLIVCMVASALFAANNSVSSAKDERANDKKAATEGIETILQKYKVEEDSVTIEGRRVPKHVVLDDFIAVALSADGAVATNNDESLSLLVAQQLGITGGDIAESVKRQYPWLFDVISKGQEITQEFPEPMVLHKWETEITIGIGWPSGAANEGETVARTTIADEIESNLVAIKELTGLTAKFVAPDDEGANDNAYAKIRVVPMANFGQKSVFKSLGMHPQVHLHGSHGLPIGVIEQSLVTAVRFTPDSLTQVDGYLLPNSDNSIGFAACKIYSDLPDDLLRSMTRECLYRSLGLTALSESGDSGILSEWNLVNAPSSKTYRRNGDEALYPIPQADGTGEAWSVGQLTPVSQHLTDYDKRQITLLYCGHLKSGMGPYEVAASLLRNTDCWKGNQ